MDQIGFVLITHTAPAQISRLIGALNQVYSNPPIVVHHDFDQCSLDLAPFRNVQLVRPHFPTQWCGFSVVRATLASVALLFETSNPDWFAVLSGACYPTKPGREVIAELEKGGCDAYIDHQRIDPFHLENEYQRECFRRYYSWSFGVENLDRRMTLPFIASLTSPYTANSTGCYAGSQWFTANRAVARYLDSSQAEYAWLAKHLRKRHCPDETYFQTLICNASQLKISNNTHRYIDWSAHKPHPKELDIDDLPAMVESSAHFARKFATNSPVLAKLDNLLGVRLR